MPCREGNKARQRLFQEAKINALPGLVEALDTETLPERSRCTLPSGQISANFDDRFLPLQPMALVTVCE